MTGEKPAGGEIIDRLSAYVAASGETELPREVIHKAKHHILDTLGAIVCGSNLKPGLLAKRFVAEQGGRPRRRWRAPPSSPRRSRPPLPWG